MNHSLASTFAAILVLSLTSPAGAQKHNPAAAELKKAKSHFDLQEYDLAEAALKEAYRLDPKSETLYAIAQAQRLGGACDRAITSYKNFLRTKPKADQAAAANENIARCEAQLAAAQKPTEPVPPPEPVELPPPPRPVEPADRALVTSSPSRPPPATETPSGVPWTKNWAAHTLLLGGAALAAGGTMLALDGNAAIAEINDARFYDDFVARSEQLDAARSRRTLGFVAAGAGGAMIVGAIVLYIVRSPDDAASTRTARIGIDPRGSIQLAWGF